MKKFKMFINIEKEEKWLNEMLQSGCLLKKTFINYTFEKTTETDQVIRLDFRTFKKEKDFVDYKLMFEDSGWMHITGSKGSGTQYFLKTDKAESDEIFSDNDSKVQLLKRHAYFWLIYSIILMMIYGPVSQFGNGFHPKDLYLTPGLWERTGPEFWKAFWFETPFAIMRGIGGYGIFILIIVYVFYTYNLAKTALKKSQID